MVNQYSKVVIGNPGIPLSKKFILKTNADFEIKNAFLFLDIKKAPNKPIGLDLKDFLSAGFVSFDGYSGRPVTIKIKLYLQNKNEIVIEEVDSKDISWVYLKKFIVTN